MIKQELEALKLKITQYESQNPFDTQIQTLTYEIEQTKSKLKKKSDKLKQLKSMKKKNFEEKETHLQNLIKEYQTSLSRDDIDIKEREAKLNTLQHENDQLKKKVDSFENNEAIEALKKNYEDIIQKKDQEIKQFHIDLKVSQKGNEQLDTNQKLKEQDYQIENLVQEFGRVEDENKKLKKDLNQSEDQHMRLLVERAKYNYVKNNLKKHRDMVQEKVTKTEKITEEQAETIKQAQLKIKNLEEQLKLEEKKTTLNTTLNDKYQVVAQNLTIVTNELKLKLQLSEEEYKQLRSNVDQKIEEFHKEQESNKRLLEECNYLKRRLEHFKKFGKVGDPLQDEQLEYYKKLFRCSVCNDRDKDSVLTRCYHFFCHQCLEDNIKKRIRRCPTCTTGFNDNNIQKIYW